MPNFTYNCQNCGEELVENVKITDRDTGPGTPCSKCGLEDWKRAHCEAKSVDTHFPGAHRLEYNKLGLRKGY
jgi:predicted nucleic acid-binding Zn ribbon protein